METTMSDIFESTPAPGAVVRDWTKKTLTLDLTNTMGEAFHFEIKPNEEDNLPTRASSSPSSEAKRGVFVWITIPLPT